MLPFRLIRKDIVLGLLVGAVLGFCTGSMIEGQFFSVDGIILGLVGSWAGGLIGGLYGYLRFR